MDTSLLREAPEERRRGNHRPRAPHCKGRRFPDAPGQKTGREGRDHQVWRPQEGSLLGSELSSRRPILVWGLAPLGIIRPSPDWEPHLFRWQGSGWVPGPELLGLFGEAFRTLPSGYLSLRSGPSVSLGLRIGPLKLLSCHPKSCLMASDLGLGRCSDHGVGTQY